MASGKLPRERFSAQRTWSQMVSLELVLVFLLAIASQGALPAIAAIPDDPLPVGSFDGVFAPSNRNPFATIPAGDVIYRDLNHLREAGILDPQLIALVSENQPLSRYEIAVYLARILSSAGAAEGKQGGLQPRAQPGVGQLKSASVSAQTAGPMSVGVGLPDRVLVDETLLDSLWERHYAAAGGVARSAFVDLLVEFSSELAVMGYQISLDRGIRRSAPTLLSAASSRPVEVGFQSGAVGSGTGERWGQADENLFVLPDWARAGTSRLEWSYRLGEAYEKSTGYSIAPAGASVAGAASGSSPAGTGQPVTGPWEGKVLVVVPTGSGGRGAAMVGLDTSYKLGSVAEARWQWLSPYNLSQGSQPVVSPGTVSTLGGEMRLLPGVTVRGELVQAFGADGSNPSSSSRVATQVVLGDVQLGASARWTQPGFPAADSVGTEEHGSRSYDLEVKGGDVTLSARLDQTGSAGASDLARFEPGRTVRAIGLTYDLNNLAVVRAGYQWIDLRSAVEGNHQQQGTAELGVGLTANGPGGTSVKADVLWQGTAGDGGGLEVSTTASLEYRLLPWSARFMTDTRLRGGRTTSTSLSVGYSPSGDTSFWIGYKLVEYRADQDTWLQDQVPENVAQAGLIIRF